MAASVNTRIPRQGMRTLLMGSVSDRILLFVSLTAIASAWFFVQAVAASGPAVAEVYFGKTLLATYPLPNAGEPPTHLQVEGSIGAAEIVIDESGVRFSASPCDAQRCVYSGAHQHAGDMIVCVPNRILIAIRGRTQGRFDAIVE
ncbi:hypothetical protein Ga0123462_0112 [Mariprofundus ferrinatatus]|uniref:Uncharacterized protein n=1 Tax=Mariprofundus ferrinatatus TaxID=1921087 RepID=A0A2K8L565_9PROT|nr:NusG domain II-containing protein [Mariprofundus ferrinatatus]ATX80991.1 hypothetical protein Ga0123462_0112 [Mariprofundus ferrinatatus]